HLAEGLAEDPVGARQGYLEVALRSRVALHEHVVGDRSQANLEPPHVGPDRRVVVHVADQGRLAAYDGTGPPDPPNGGLGDGWLELADMAVVAHDRQVLPTGHHELEQA